MIALDELEACFYAGKRHQIEQRRTEEILRDDTTESTPPLSACGRLSAACARTRTSLLK
ncbi:DUF6191 domain-containing protein [Parafrankia sp. FMc6]|uniref:DUF6191 domain-containing protein n=1 Tax=Parafrankia soli TaxID=2599596 RepID=UPI0034D42EFD